MNWIDTVHGGFVHGRRAGRLAESLAGMLPASARVLDLGTGDGLVASRILSIRPDVSIEGMDVLPRPDARIPVRTFDGYTIPAPDGEYDTCLLVDVLHHAGDPLRLLQEAARVAQRCVVVKDHLREGLLAGPTLHFMDRVGNDRHGVVVRGVYWNQSQWRSAWSSSGLRVDRFQGRLGLYPWWADWWFGRTLHFVAVLSHERHGTGHFESS